MFDIHIREFRPPIFGLKVIHPFGPIMCPGLKTHFAAEAIFLRQGDSFFIVVDQELPISAKLALFFAVVVQCVPVAGPQLPYIQIVIIDVSPRRPELKMRGVV